MRTLTRSTAMRLRITGPVRWEAAAGEALHRKAQKMGRARMRWTESSGSSLVTSMRWSARW